ncbi:YpiB family protein [Alkalihalobacterium bogoriense]|uniref:YpiB family protein n=1 Tax=Alkalihalobacterium bogoriense TaxID=246272 RepID=UPI00047A662B|nr:YpiB family protein [Alkalihalobacterium bogoriense]
MNRWVSTTEKKQFLRWFLDNHRLKRTEARMIIEYIVKHPHLLENISFTERVPQNGKAIVISSINSDEPGFEFYYRKRKSDNISHALGELMGSPSDRVYLLIHFHGKMRNHHYTQLVESPALDNIKRYEQFQKYSKEADVVIEKAMLETKKAELRKQIDDALDEMNEPLFKKLVAELNELEQKLA